MQYLKSIYLLLMFSLWLSHYNIYAQNTMIIETKAQLDSLKDGDTIVVRGTYLLINLAKRPGAKSYGSRAEVMLKDAALAIESGNEGVRSEEERKKFTGKIVLIKGVYRKLVQLWGTPEQASIVSDCLKDIIEIRLE